MLFSVPFSLLSLAQTNQYFSVTDTIKTEAKVKKTAADTAKVKKAKPTAYETLIAKGGSFRKGMLNIRHIEDKWYFEVPTSLVGRLMLVVTRFASVPQGFTYNLGEAVNENTVYFEHPDAKTLLLRGFVKTQYASGKDNFSQAVEKAAVDPIIAKYDVIENKKCKDTLLIDITKMLMTDNGLFSFSTNDRKALKIGSLQADRTFIDTIKTYPMNVEILTTRTYAVEPGRINAAQTGAVTLSLNTSIVLLPEKPMQARLEDERVGYFVKKVTRFNDYAKTDHDAIISRFRLEPKNEKAYLAGKLTEPKKQIVYYIDPATPKKWVPYLIAGINDWNKAFEAAGFKNAIVAKEWPNDPTMSVDDARFCVLRYLPSEKANAYGPRIVDPRSGEILESHICWYHNVTDLLRRWYMVQCGPLDKRAQTMHFSDELMGQLIRFVSSHEVGHTLGLRHNMIASSATPVEKLRDRQWVKEHGHTASIMDYARFNYVAQPGDGMTEHELFPRINDYDKWAIKWGYQWRPEFKGDIYKEKAALRAEVTKVLKANKRLRYLGDEGRGQNPNSQTEDLGDDNMKANEYGIQNLKRVMANIEKWTAQPDGQYDDLKDIYDAVLDQYQRYCGHVQRWIAGKFVANWPTDKPLDYVSKEKQKEVLAWMDRNMLTVPRWLYPANVTEKVNFEPGTRITNRINGFIGYITQPSLLNSLIQQGKYPVNEWLDDVMAIVWKPMSRTDEFQNRYRRSMERAYINSLEKSLVSKDDKQTSSQDDTKLSDVYLYLIQNMNKIEKFINSQLATTTDGDLDNLHYKDLLVKIKKIRKGYEGDR
jgi:hypothetical protein